MEQKRIAVIRIYGKLGLKKQVKDTLNMLRLYKKNSCTIISNKKNYVGMLKRVNEYVTWGEVTEDVVKTLLEKRGKLALKKHLTENYLKEKLNITLSDFCKEFMSFKKEFKNIPGLKPFFKLSPPRGGFERGGIKKPFTMGGVVGYRKDKINDLIKKMV